jgi:RNA polymerase sigma-70 factor (ECF subfamily)
VNAVRENQFDGLYREYYGMVLQLCLGFFEGDEEQAKDLTQEVFIQVWNNLAKFRGDAAPKTWIYRITVNTCLNYLKKQKSQDRRLAEALRAKDPMEEVPPNEIDPVKVLYAAMTQLSEIDRLVTGLLLEEVPQGEIAAILGISDGNLRVRIHRIKKRLKKIISHE